MVIERYRSGPGPVYERAAARGRMLPDGLRYVTSWVAAGDMSQCFQLMETDDPALFDAWTERWRDLVAFEVAGGDHVGRSGRAGRGRLSRATSFAKLGSRDK